MIATGNPQLDNMLSRLDRVVSKGDGWEAECPCHDDATNSLCVGCGDDGSYEWDFGDGDSGSGCSIEHSYDDPGDYTVRLTVTGPCGEDTERKTDFIMPVRTKAV